MSLPKWLIPAAVFLALTWLTTDAARAQGYYLGGPTNTSEGFKLRLQSDEPLGSQAAQRAFVTFGTNQFTFVLPPGFGIDASNPQKIVLANADYSCYLTFQLSGPLPGGLWGLNSDAYRELASSQRPGAIILNQFSQRAANHDGPAFDLQWTNSSGSAQSGRVAFIPSPAGVLEFSMASNPDTVRDGQYALNWMMLTFRSNEGGKLEINRLSDKY
jgi:hypothetical protein